mgnify:CR=1 FL=1
MNEILKNTTKEELPSIKELRTGEITRFSCTIDSKEVGFVTLTLIDKDVYDISGLFVGPSERGQGISTKLLKSVNNFLEKNNALGKLVNTIKGDTANLYEKNNWVKGDYSSHGAYGAYEYTYDCRKK